MKIKHLTILITLLGTILSTHAASVVDLGDLGGASGEGAAHGVSADGSVVVGYSTATNDMSVAFRWTQANGMKGLGDPPWVISSSLAFGVSGDGQVVVGFGRTAAGRGAFRWTTADGMVDLAGTSTPSNCTALAASSNGAVIVGNAMWETDITLAFRWTAGDGMVSLGDLPGGETDSGALGVSADGAVVVGAGTTTNGYEPFRWTATNGLESLGDLPGGNVDGWANAVSADGQVIVGGSSATNGYEAFRWTRSTGMVSLGTLPGFADFEAKAVSADGNTVVGFCFPTNGTQDLIAFVWTPAGGMKKLADVLAARGADLSHWQSLLQAYGVSADGRWVCGYGITTNDTGKPFLADLGASITLQPVDDSTIGTYHPTNTGNNSQFVLEGWISGYTHRPLLKFDLSFIPDGARVLSAELTLLHNLWNGNSAASFPTEVWRMPNDNWSEATVTWDSYDQTGGVAVAIRQPQATNWNVMEPWFWNIRIADWNYGEDLLDDAVTFETRWGDENNQWWKFTGFSSKEGTVAPALKIVFVPDSPAPPRLSLTRSNNEVAVSWPSPSTGWNLQQNTNSVSSVNWSNVTSGIQEDGSNKTLIVNPPAGNRFYRLHKP